MSDTAKTVFTDVFQSNAWGNAESISGPGSTLAATRHVQRELLALCRALGVRSLLDLPCGDFGWMQAVDLASAGIAYIGGDIVDPLIQANRARYARADLRFEVLDLCRSALPKADLVLCRDCLVHLPFADIFMAVRNLQRSGSRWLLTTHFPWLGAGHNVDILIGQWRRLNLATAPMQWQAGWVLPEGCDIDGFQDKSLALFDLKTLRC